MRLGLALLAGAVRPGPDVDIRRVSRVRIDAAVPVPVQIDGESFGTTPLVIEEAAEILRIVVSPGRAAPPEGVPGGR
jgi:diacylglycerol kinase (ATP)